MKSTGNRIGFVVLASALVFLFLAFAAGPATGQEYSKQQQMIDKAKMTFQKFVADPNVGWGPKQAERVKGLMIVPQLLRGAFIFGGAGGSGVFLMRDAKTGKWSEPGILHHGVRKLWAPDRRRFFGNRASCHDHTGCGDLPEHLVQARR